MPVKKIIIAVIILGVIFGLSGFVFASADKYGIDKTYEKSKLANVGISNTTPESLAASVVTVVLGFVGTIFFLLVLYGGITWMMAMGSQEKVTKAKSILEMAIIGMVIVAASYAISTYIFSRLMGAPSATCHNGQGTCRDSCINSQDEVEGNLEDNNECVGAQICCFSPTSGT